MKKEKGIILTLLVIIIILIGGNINFILEKNAIIKNIDTTRILQELEKRKIVIIAGFQGYNENLDITTLGRGGSDTSAIAIAAGDEVEVDFDSGVITDITTGKKFQGQAFPPFMQKIIDCEGLVNYINQK